MFIYIFFLWQGKLATIIWGCALSKPHPCVIVCNYERETTQEIAYATCIIESVSKNWTCNVLIRESYSIHLGLDLVMCFLGDERDLQSLLDDVHLLNLVL